MDLKIEKRLETLERGDVIRHRFFEDGERMSFDQAIGLMDESAEFRSYLSTLLAEIPFKAFCWECKPVKVDTIDSGFEFVVINDRRLTDTANSKAFSEHLDTQDLVTSFENLGGDAVLVVPEPHENVPGGYAHFAQFIRNAPEAQKHALWELLAAEIEANLTTELLWINTAGHGVPWLHVRLDDRPKYYQFTEYKEWLK